MARRICTSLRARDRLVSFFWFARNHRMRACWLATMRARWVVRLFQIRQRQFTTSPDGRTLPVAEPGKLTHASAQPVPCLNVKRTRFAIAVDVGFTYRAARRVPPATYLVPDGRFRQWLILKHVPRAYLAEQQVVRLVEASTPIINAFPRFSRQVTGIEVEGKFGYVLVRKPGFRKDHEQRRFPQAGAGRLGLRGSDF